ncbi:MAG TPA: ABC transporter permease [Chloroflexaceae bacterium]|nr:ABC transporter permease [Chloroflexaceae bacterium]
MRRLLVLIRLILTIELRHPAVLFWNFAFPVGVLLINGAIFGAGDAEPGATAAWLAAGIIVLNIMAGAFLGDSARLVHVREQGILQRVQASPLPAGTLVLSYTAVRLLLVLIQAALIVTVAVLALGARFAVGGVLSAAVIALAGALAFILVGQAIAAVAPGVGAANALGQTIYFPLMFISNLFLPAELLPDWIAAVARWTPAFMLVDVLRPAMVDVPAQQSGLLNLLGLALFGAAGLAIAARHFRWEPWR